MELNVLTSKLNRLVLDPFRLAGHIIAVSGDFLRLGQTGVLDASATL